MRPSWDKDRKVDSVQHILIHKLMQYCPTGCVGSAQMPDTSELRKESCLSNYALKQGSTHAANEKLNLWTARLCIEGNRKAAVFKADDIKNHLKALGIIGKSQKDWLKETSIAGMTAHLSAGYTVYTGTVGERDMLWLPAHSYVLENVGGQKDTIGLRWSMVASRDEVRMQGFRKTAASKLTPSLHVSKHVVEIANRFAEIAAP